MTAAGIHQSPTKTPQQCPSEVVCVNCRCCRAGRTWGGRLPHTVKRTTG